jgi:hypothetical protein
VSTLDFYRAVLEGDPYSVRSDTLDQRVVVGQHGWWQGCKELGIADSDPADPNGSNFNLTVDAIMRDAISGTPSHRFNMCEVRPVRRDVHAARYDAA